MAYNPYDAVNAIHKFKGQWDAANNAGDDAKKNKAAQDAQAYYNQLRSNGYSDVADELAASDYASSKKINDRYAKSGKTETRPYLYSLGQKYGMSNKDIDNQISYDDLTGEISFGGKKIGKPDVEIDGTSYWKDTSKLDNSFNDYIKRSGTTRTNESAINQENENLFSKYNREYEDLKSVNPFETDEAKSIFAKYNLDGYESANNAKASSAASNGGNIDSYAAANAARQQLAYKNAGTQAVLNAYQQKLDHAKNLLSDMGVNIERTFNENETAKNNAVSRDVAIAGVTGTVPTSMNYASNPYFNSDGTLKNEEIDYQAVINNAQAKLENETDSDKIADLKATIKFANQARNYKIQSNPAYAKFADTMTMYAPDETADYRLTKEQIASAERISDSSNATQFAIAEREAQSNDFATAAAAETAKYQTDIEAQTAASSGSGGKSSSGKPNLTAAQASAAIKNGEISQAVIDAYNYWYGTDYTVDDPPGGSGNMPAWVNWANGRKTNFEYDENTGKLKYIGDGEYDTQVVLVQAALNDKQLTDSEKSQIAKLFSASVIDEATKRIRRGQGN